MCKILGLKVIFFLFRAWWPFIKYYFYLNADLEMDSKQYLGLFFF